MRPERCKGRRRTGPGPPQTETVGVIGAGGERQRPEGGRSGGQTAGSGSAAERSLQRGTEADRTGLRPVSQASDPGWFGAERAGFDSQLGLMRAWFESEVQRSGSGFGAEPQEDESETESELLQYLAKNFVLKLREPRGL